MCWRTAHPGRMRSAVCVLIAAVALWWSTPVALAASDSAPLQLSVQVVASCILQARDLDFGEYLGVEKNSSTQILVKCQKELPFQLALDAGQHYDGIYRRLARGNDSIPYNLKQPNGHEWGDSDFANTYKWAASAPGTGTGSWQVLAVNGTLSGGFIVGAGHYQDTVLATIHF